VRNIPHKYVCKRIHLEWAYFENLFFTTEEQRTELKRQDTLHWQTRQRHDSFGCEAQFTNRIVDTIDNGTIKMFHNNSRHAVTLDVNSTLQANYGLLHQPTVVAGVCRCQQMSSSCRHIVLLSVNQHSQAAQLDGRNILLFKTHTPTSIYTYYTIYVYTYTHLSHLNGISVTVRQSVRLPNLQFLFHERDRSHEPRWWRLLITGGRNLINISRFLFTILPK